MMMKKKEKMMKTFTLFGSTNSLQPNNIFLSHRSSTSF